MVCSSSVLAFLSLTLLGVENALSFSCFATTTTTRPITFLGSSPSENNGGAEDKIDAELVETSELTEENIEAVGNLVADDEWAGVTLELGELVRTAVIEDIKSNAREFLGKDEYKVGDLSKEIDERVKQGVADLRGKDNYEVGDLVLTLDEMSKSMTEELTGKPYEVGDLSKEIDSRVKGAVASYIGKDEYEAGDLTKAIAGNVKTRVEELTKNYEFGDISKEIERRRRVWAKSVLGEDYRFGDISKNLANKFTGKDEYEFGDVTKKVIGNLFGKKKKE